MYIGIDEKYNQIYRRKISPEEKYVLNCAKATLRIPTEKLFHQVLFSSFLSTHCKINAFRMNYEILLLFVRFFFVSFVVVEGCAGRVDLFLPSYLIFVAGEWWPHRGGMTMSLPFLLSSKQEGDAQEDAVAVLSNRERK